MSNWDDNNGNWPGQGPPPGYGRRGPGASSAASGAYYGSRPPVMMSPEDGERLHQLESLMRQIRESPLGVAVVASIDEKRRRMTLSLGPAGLVEVARYKDAKVGDQVLVVRDTMAIVEVASDARPTGLVATALDVAPGLVEVEIAQARRVVRTSSPVAVGERVIIDPGMVHVVGSLGMPKPTHVAPETRVSWDDVGGNEGAKQQLREAVELPFHQPELYAEYGKRPAKGVLLSGPPGCGKTLLGKATATAIARAHGRDRVAAGGFQYLKGPELLSKWLGESEAAIRALFAEARAFRAAHGHPSVIFLDEADALLGDRARGTNVSINATTVPQFLAEMDGFDEPCAVFLLATNRPEMLDAAVTREGRVDRKVRVDRPSQRDAAQILAIHLRGRPLAEGAQRDHVADEVAARIFSPGALVVRDYGPAQLELRHMISGAMLAELVEQASTTALYRDVAEARKSAGGIRASDLLGALEAVRLGQRDIDHAGVLRELAEAEAFGASARATDSTTNQGPEVRP